MRITKLSDLDGLSLKDAARLPHPSLLMAWDGLYKIDVACGVFRVIR